jgi:2,4-dienoyl-CoA reductase-like NADH-dependent reductase (Old Yellow Enzyme family)
MQKTTRLTFFVNTAGTAAVPVALAQSPSGDRRVAPAGPASKYTPKVCAAFARRRGEYGLGWPGAPGLWNQDQVEGWKTVTQAVHHHGGRIVAQLWHMGRLVHPAVSGMEPVSSSAVTAPDYAHTYEGKRPHVEPRAATPHDIARIVGDYARAARNAISAGFDGIQIHGANGYLVDQFLRDGANFRTTDMAARSTIGLDS